MSLRFINYKTAQFPAGRIGLVNANGSKVTPLNYPTGRPAMDLKVLIRDWDMISTTLQPGQPELDIDTVEILAPVTGRDVLCVGKNYAEHAREFQKSGYDSSDVNEQPDFPVIFTKRATSIVGTGIEIFPHPNVTSKLDYEGELAVIIGKAGINIQKADAWQYVWGATILNDVTARERQRDHKQFYIGKSLDTFCPMGPYAVHASQLDWKSMELQTRVNGEIRQKQSTNDLIFDIPTLIETCSRGITLQPGDVLATGTPAGVGIGRSPPTFLQSGDVIEVEITGLGTLKNKIGDSSAAPPACRPLLADVPPTGLADTALRSFPSGVHLHVEVSNPDAEKTIIFVHGLGGALTNYAPIVEAADLLSSYKVVLFDFEGHGLSPASGSSTTVEVYAASIGEVLDSVGSKRAVIVGHSLGGLIATTFAATNPDRVEKLVLLGPVKKFAPAGVEALTKRAQTVRDGGMIAVADTVANAGVSAKTNSSRALAKAIVRTSLLTTPAEGYAQACLAAAAADDPDYSQITAPTLIFAGDEDKTCPKPTVDFLRDAIKNAKVVQLADVGHWHQVEDHETVARELKAFL
ncbi:A/B superfamily hydrolase [Rhodotorula taiwanensis]|uniref:A/B superfamily hydrolase n=1 Tax=Rhodotorula taiwanensis TaxID=741276 RepID=A0A2S5B169_9BASI|nr:A/B superfamily hydrolase [Rhodotorula taiwanensis]